MERCETSRAFIVFSGEFRISRRLTTQLRDSRVASNIRVAGGKENTFGQRSLSDMQIARLALFEVNEKKELLEKEPALPGFGLELEDAERSGAGTRLALG